LDLVAGSTLKIEQKETAFASCRAKKFAFTLQKPLKTNMKHITLLGSVFAFTALQAQITITSGDFGSAGESFTVGTHTAPGVSPGSAGPNQTWDFSALITQSLDTVQFLNPTGLPGATSFPGANLAIESNDGLFYFDKSSSGVNTLGGASSFGGVPAVAVYNPPQTLLPFPAAYNDQFTSSTAFNTELAFPIDTNILGCVIKIDSIRIVRNSTLNTAFDAWGTVTLPTGSFPSLRANSLESTTDSIFIYVPNGLQCLLLGVNEPAGWILAPNLLIQAAGFPGNVIQAASRIYTWYANGEKFGVLAMQMDDQNNVESARFKSDASQLVSIEDNEATTWQVTPNPAGESVNFGLTQPGLVTVTDLSGRIIWENEVQPNTAVSIADWKDGLYVYTVQQGQKVVGKGKLVVQH
jgi:hypothetical protein